MEKFMLKQSEVDQWLTDFLKRLRKSFRERLIFVGHHGSWARGEAGITSDIDSIVIIDHIDTQDLTAFRDIIDAMPDAKHLASGGLFSISEIKTWPRFELIQLFYGCKTLHGTLNGIVEKPKSIDFKEDIRVKASSNLRQARHYLLYPHDWSKSVHKLYYPFKSCFYALQSWILLLDGKFIARKDKLLDSLSNSDDREVIQVVKDWKQLEQDLKKRPLYYIELLERWSRNMLLRLRAYESNGDKKAW